eukprot:3325940-Pyramimonas_sp.AAC.1
MLMSCWVIAISARKASKTPSEIAVTRTRCQLLCQTQGGAGTRHFLCLPSRRIHLPRRRRRARPPPLEHFAPRAWGELEGLELAADLVGGWAAARPSFL